MQSKSIITFVLSLLFVFVGCSSYRHRAEIPKPRPLGSELDVILPENNIDTSFSTKLIEEPENVLSLNQAKALALTGNPELSGFAWEIRAAEARTLQAGLLPNPEFEFEMEEFGGDKERRGLRSSVYNFRFNQLIELGGKRNARTRLATFESDLAAWEYESKRLDVLTAVTNAFIEVLSAQEKLALRQDLARLAEEMYETVRLRVQAGKVSPLEESKAKVEFSINRLRKEQAERALWESRRQLVALWGSTTPRFKRVEGHLHSLSPVPEEEKLRSQISSNPDVAKWEVELQKQESGLQMARAGRIPDLTIGGGLQRFSEPDETTFILSFSIPIPLFDRNQGEILESISKQAKAKSQKLSAEIKAATDLSKSYSVLASAYEEAITLEKDVLPAARFAFDASSEGYKQGKFGYLEMLDAQRTLFEVQEQQIEILTVYHRAKANVERLIGDSLEHFTGAMQAKNPEDENEQ